jgi:hypothetical protein
VVPLLRHFATRFTICFVAFDLLPLNCESPPYAAITKLAPTLSVEVVKLAEPPANVPVPSTAPPFKNETVSPSWRSADAGTYRCVKRHSLTESGWVWGRGDCGRRYGLHELIELSGCAAAKVGSTAIDRGDGV